MMKKYEYLKDCINTLENASDKLYNTEVNELTEGEVDEWFKRGCETWFPTAKYCSKFKRSWKNTVKMLKWLIINK